MTTRHQRILTKLLVNAAIALVLWAGGTVAASAGRDSDGTDSNPSGRDCSCQATCPADSTEQGTEIDRGIRDGLCAWSSGRSAGQPNQPRQ
jgi:hypothetical protein